MVRPSWERNSINVDTSRLSKLVKEARENMDIKSEGKSLDSIVGRMGDTYIKYKIK